MDLQTRKLELIRVFLNLQNEDIIISIENMLKKEQVSTFKEPINPFSTDELNKRIDLSIEDSKNGKLIEVNDLIAEIEKWN